MSVRVIIKDVKKRTKACDECKRRKGRCDGGMPCEWCATRNLECVFSAFSQKRGPKKKRKIAGGGFESDDEETDTLTLDKRELGMTYDLELGNYLGMFMNFFDPMFTMFKQWDKTGSKVAQLSHPRSYPQFITKYAACAIAARATGQKERASQLINEARSFAGHCFDEMSTDSLIGFMLLGAYWIGVDSRVTKHYYNIALSIYGSLQQTALPANIRYIMAMSSVMLNNAISDGDKIKVYLADAQTIVAQNNVQVLLGSLLRMCIKTFAHMKCFDATLMRSDIVAVLLCQVIFSEKQRQHILEDLRYCRNLLKVCHDLPADLSTLISLMFTNIEVFVEWRSGHSELALPLAIEFANKLTNDTIKFGNKFDVQHLLYISIFLREQQHLGLADKVRKTADALHTSVCEAVPDLATSADPLASYLRRKPQSHQSAFLALTAPAAKDPYNSIDDNVVPTMVSNVLSLVSQLLPTNESKSLLTAQGLHLFYNTLSSIMPPSPSPYDIQEEPVATVIASTFYCDDQNAPSALSSDSSSPSSPNSSPKSTYSSTPPITPPDLNTYSSNNTTQSLSPSTSPSNNYVQTTFLDTNTPSTSTSTSTTTTYSATPFTLSNGLSQNSIPLTMMFMFDNNDPATPIPMTTFNNSLTVSNKINTINTNTNNNNNYTSSQTINNNNYAKNTISNNNNNNNNIDTTQYSTEPTTYQQPIQQQQQQQQPYIPQQTQQQLTTPPNKHPRITNHTSQPTIQTQNVQYTYITNNTQPQQQQQQPQQQTQQQTLQPQHQQQQYNNTPIPSPTPSQPRNSNTMYNQMLKNNTNFSPNVAMQFLDSSIVPVATVSNGDWDWMDDWNKLVANPN